MTLYEVFLHPASGMPMVPIYPQRGPVPVRGTVGDITSISVDRRMFKGVIKQIDKAVAILALG